MPDHKVQSNCPVQNVKITEDVLFVRFRFFLVFFVVLLSVWFPGFSQSRLSIDGRIGSGQKLEKIEFGVIRAKQKERVLEVLRVADNSFHIEMEADGMETYFLRIGDRKGTFDLGPGSADILVKDSLLRNISVGNNPAYDEQRLYISQLQADTNFTGARRARAARDDYQSGKNVDPAVLAQKTKRYQELEELSRQTDIRHFYSWLKERPNSYVNAKMLFGMIGILPDSTIKSLFAQLPGQVKAGSWSKLTRYWIDSLSVGGTFPKSLFYDTKGRVAGLQTVGKHQYLLVDFWASWCIPCRQENPMMAAVYKKYKNNGLGVVGVSVDADKKAWLDAIEADRLEWTQLLGSAQSYDRYLFKAIPSNFLLDTDGRVVARNLSAADLEKFLNLRLRRPQ